MFFLKIICYNNYNNGIDCMVILKNRIRTINSLPNDKKEKVNTNIIITILTIVILFNTYPFVIG